MADPARFLSGYPGYVSGYFNYLFNRVIGSGAADTPELVLREVRAELYWLQANSTVGPTLGHHIGRLLKAFREDPRALPYAALRLRWQRGGQAR